MRALSQKVESTWLVPAGLDGVRADLYLKRRIGRISRARASRIIEAGDFLLDGQAIKPSCRVKNGQRATLKRFAPDFVEDIKQFSVAIIFEDEDILVLDKPAGLAIHPSANCLYKTLTYWLRCHFPRQKINPCHRIDKETSGIVVCAKNFRAESSIKIAFMKSKVRKLYLAIVEGLVAQSRAITFPLGLQKEKGLVAIRMIEDKLGKAAITKIRPLRYDQSTNRTLVLCYPLTGRQHQIRAHLSLLGHPLVGDKLYGAGDEFFDRLSRGFDDGLKDLAHHRHALHAARLRFRFNNKTMAFKCPLPKDLIGLIGTRCNTAHLIKNRTI